MSRPKEQSIDKPPRLALSQTVQVPEAVARCPECNARVWVTAQVVDAKTLDLLEVDVDCIHDARKMDHRYRQSDWQPVRDAVNQWLGVVD